MERIPCSIRYGTGMEWWYKQNCTKKSDVSSQSHFDWTLNNWIHIGMERWVWNSKQTCCSTGMERGMERDVQVHVPYQTVLTHGHVMTPSPHRAKLPPPPTKGSPPRHDKGPKRGILEVLNIKLRKEGPITTLTTQIVGSCLNIISLPAQPAPRFDRVQSQKSNLN